MKRAFRIWVLIFFTLLAIAITGMLKPIPQDPGYHQFADQNPFLGIPNFLNILTNLPFVMIGVIGLLLLRASIAPDSIKSIYAVLFTGIVLTGIGSAYYHYAPNNNTLVYDRVPMTIVFMSLFVATVGERINIKLANKIFIPLLILGIGSVIWWHHTELAGRGDLRFYGFIQFYPILVIPLIISMYSTTNNNQQFRFLIWVVVWYIIAKACEHFDYLIYQYTRLISGHSLKHLAAAVATWYIVMMFTNKHMPKKNK